MNILNSVSTKIEFYVKKKEYIEIRSIHSIVNFTIFYAQLKALFEFIY